MLHKLFDAPEISLSQIYAKVTVPAGQSLQQRKGSMQPGDQGRRQKQKSEVG